MKQNQMNKYNIESMGNSTKTSSNDKTNDDDLSSSITSCIVNRVRNKYCSIVYVNKIHHSVEFLNDTSTNLGK